MFLALVSLDSFAILMRLVDFRFLALCPLVRDKGVFWLGAMIAEDERYMRLALSLAELGRSQTSPNPMVGAVLVKNGEVVGQGAHLKPGEPHAEVHALRMAGEKAKGATAYVTLEPCSHYGRTPPCADALVQAGVKRVVVAIEDPDPRVQGHGLAKLRAAGIEVKTGVLADQAAELNEAYLTFKQTGRPFVIWKCAATLDGYIATHSGHSAFVTGPESRRTVHELRRKIPAIAVGIQTVLSDNPRLTVRLQDFSRQTEAYLGGGAAQARKAATELLEAHELVRQPLRVVFDSRLRMPTTARMLKEPGRTLIFTTDNADLQQRERCRALTDGGADIVALPANEVGRVPIQAALLHLAELGYDELLLEGGATLAGAFLKEHWIDKVIYYVAPKLLGGGLPALSSVNPATMKQAIALRDVTVQALGSDLRFEGYPVYSSETDLAKED